MLCCNKKTNCAKQCKNGSTRTLYISKYQTFVKYKRYAIHYIKSTICPLAS